MLSGSISSLNNKSGANLKLVFVETVQAVENQAQLR